ncbi:hypothetical protein [Pseudomarimonas arenosa]|uniref:DUF4124 domain-containing protein n=1 Tax=Pseudomarimonas arenosa TaxID=2774145 RepID=A0AAW3ZHJ3_9GAMM|nr:hypothetical protein [Pseudomarimonas arenosa]MBD8524219.1 hypothetical protein [Pseudomarimonas arenosa]
MQKVATISLVVSVVLLAALGGDTALAQDAIDELVYRCEDAQGHRIYSDMPCHQLGAMALPSVLQPQSPEPSEPGSDAQPPSANEPLPTPREAEGCPGRQPEMLVANLIEAADAKELNRLAALFHWPAAGRGTVKRVFSIAERLAAAAPLLGNLKRREDEDAWLWAGLPPPDKPPLPIVSVRSIAQPSVQQQFELIENAGCFWLLPP